MLLAEYALVHIVIGVRLRFAHLLVERGEERVYVDTQSAQNPHRERLVVNQNRQQHIFAADRSAGAVVVDGKFASLVEHTLGARRESADFGSLVQRADKRRAVCGFAYTHRRQDFAGAALGNVEYAEQDVFAAHIRRSVIPGGIQRKFDGFLQIDGKFTEVVHISPCGQPPASV